MTECERLRMAANAIAKSNCDNSSCLDSELSGSANDGTPMACQS